MLLLITTVLRLAVTRSNYRRHFYKLSPRFLSGELSDCDTVGYSALGRLRHGH